MAPTRVQNAGAMHKLTALMRINGFAVRPLDGKCAHITSENVILDLHRPASHAINRGIIARKVGACGGLFIFLFEQQNKHP